MPVVTRTFQPINPQVRDIGDVQRQLRRASNSMYLFDRHIGDHPWVSVVDGAYDPQVHPVCADLGLGVVNDVADWQPTHAYLAGDWVKPVTFNGYIYQCVLPGNSGAAEPGWGTTIGSDTLDNAIWMWRCRGNHCIQTNVDWSTTILSRTPIVYVANNTPYYGVIEAVLPEWLVFSGPPLTMNDTIQAIRLGYSSQIEQRHFHVINAGNHHNLMEAHMGEIILWDRQVAHIATFAVRTIGAGAVSVNLMTGDPPATFVSCDDTDEGIEIAGPGTWYWNEWTSIHPANAILWEGDRLEIDCSLDGPTDVNVDVLFVSEDREMARILTSLQE